MSSITPSTMSATASARTCSTRPSSRPSLEYTGVPASSARYELGAPRSSMPARLPGSQRGLAVHRKPAQLDAERLRRPCSGLGQQEPRARLGEADDGVTDQARQALDFISAAATLEPAARE